MNIIVMGSGAVGGYFGAVLVRAGHKVTFIARGDHLETMRVRGLQVESVTSGSFTIDANAVPVLDGLQKADLVLFCVKGYDNEKAITTVEPGVGPNTTILTLQNGLGSGDQLAGAFGKDNVLLGATYIDAVKKVAGVVSEHGGDCNIIFGAENGVRTQKAVNVHNAFKDAGIDATLSETVTVDLWSKLIYICALSGMTCITKGTMAEVLETPETLEMSWQVMREAEAVGRAIGIAFEDDIVGSKMAILHAEKQEIVSSMRTDLDRGNPLEVHVLNGAVARMGREVGVPTPVNSFIANSLTIHHNRAMVDRCMV